MTLLGRRVKPNRDLMPVFVSTSDRLRFVTHCDQSPLMSDLG
jgi:hypothetical protein